MQGKTDKIQLHESRKTLRRLAKEYGKILMCEDGFADFEKCSVMLGLGHLEGPGRHRIFAIVWSRSDSLATRDDHD